YGSYLNHEGAQAELSGYRTRSNELFKQARMTSAVAYGSVAAQHGAWPYISLRPCRPTSGIARGILRALQGVGIEKGGKIGPFRGARDGTAAISFVSRQIGPERMRCVIGVVERHEDVLRRERTSIFRIIVADHIESFDIHHGSCLWP